MARQKADAAREIKNKITLIKSSTHETVSEIRQTSEVIGQVDAIVSEITRAVETESQASGEVSQKVVQAAGGIGEVSEFRREAGLLSCPAEQSRFLVTKTIALHRDRWQVPAPGTSWSG